MRLHFSIGCYDRRRTSRCRQSIHFSRIQILLADHVQRRAGVYNKFSFLRFKGWCRQAPIFRRWEEWCFIFLLYFWYTLGQLPRCFTGSSLLPFRLFLRPILKFWSIGVTLMRITWAYHSERRILVSIFFAWRTTAFVNFTHRIGFRMFELFREIDEDFGGSISWNAQPNCCVFDESYTTGLPVLSYSSCFLQHGHGTFVIILLGPLAGLFINLAMRIKALFLKSASILGLVEQALWRVPFFKEWIGASSFEAILARRSSNSSTWASASGTFGSRCISLFLPRSRARRRIRLCRFCTLIEIVSETANVSFRRLPVGFPLPTISQNSLSTMFCPLILDQGVPFIISISAKNSYFVNSARYFFLP